MSKLNLEEIKTRAEAATPGPWAVYNMADTNFDSRNERGWWWVWKADVPHYAGVMEVGEGSPRFEGEQRVSDQAIGGTCITDYEDGDVERHDAEFIAHAREDVPALIAEVERYRDEGVYELRERGFRVLGDEQCCELACDSGACESCPCCAAGWCVWGTHNEIPSPEENYEIWLEEASEHNVVAARLRDVEAENAQLLATLQQVRELIGEPLAWSDDYPMYADVDPEAILAVLDKDGENRD